MSDLALAAILLVPLAAAALLAALPDDRTTAWLNVAASFITFCAALTRHHTGEERGAFPALAARFPDLRPLLEKMAEDHVLVAGITARVEAIAQEMTDARSPALLAELDGLAAILDSHFAFEERRIRGALDELGGSATELLGG